MSADQSNLSDPKYGYHMVVATTQSAVNATMQEWLDKFKGQPFIQAYVYNPESKKPSPIDFDQFKTDLGFDPFTIPDGTDPENERIRLLKDKKFLFAFQIENGLPDFPIDPIDIDPINKIPPAIAFKKEGTSVTYNMVCKTFKIINLELGGYSGPEWINLSQSDSQVPWVFSFNVDLDLRTEDINNHFSKLPAETQKAIKNLGMDMFSIQQLFFDLNAAGLSDIPEIKGLDPSSKVAEYLRRFFISGYIADLRKNGGIMLGLSVISQKPFPKNVSLIPTDLTFMISSYKDGKGKATDDYNAYTLNYLIVSKDRDMPVPNQFTWNWVEKDKISQYAGVVAINRNTFIDFLYELLSKGLNKIVMKPYVIFKVNCDEINWEYNLLDTTAKQQFETTGNRGPHVLTYSYSMKVIDKDEKKCGFKHLWQIVHGEFELKYSVSSDVYLESNTIRMETTITIYIRFKYLKGVAQGNIAKKKCVITYTIGVNNQGKIAANWGSGPQKTDLSEDINIDDVLKTKIRDINKTIVSIRDHLKNLLDQFLTDRANEIAAMLNGSNTWVFPGGKTYSFMNVRFSDNQDLVANVLYHSPKLNTDQIQTLLVNVRENPALLNDDNLSFETLMKEVEDAVTE